MFNTKEILGHSSSSSNSMNSQNSKNNYVSSKRENEITIEENKKIIIDRKPQQKINQDMDLKKADMNTKFANRTLVDFHKNLENINTFKFKEKFEKLKEEKTVKKADFSSRKIELTNKNYPDKLVDSQKKQYDKILLKIENLKHNLTDILVTHYADNKNNIKEEETKIKQNKHKLVSEKLKLIDEKYLKKLNINSTLKLNNITEKHLNNTLIIVAGKNSTHKINSQDDKKKNYVDHLINLHKFRI